MEYISAGVGMADEILAVLHNSIRTVYPKYYPKEVVEFFCRLHCRDHVLEGVASGGMGVLTDNGVIVGTGCFDGNHITGVYVSPRCQRKGFGSFIMDRLEEKIAEGFEKAVLDASLPAVCLYERRGYRTVGHGVYKLENDVRLVYEIMEKSL